MSERIEHVENENGEVSEENETLGETQVKVRWSLINNDLGKHHNTFVEEFPNCLFVRIIQCGVRCGFKAIAVGGVALIREEVMILKGKRKLDAGGRVSIDREAPFVITQEDILAFGKFENL